MHLGLQTHLQMAEKFSCALNPSEVIDIFEGAKCWDGLFKFLKSIVAQSSSQLVHTKYIIAAARTSHCAEV